MQKMLICCLICVCSISLVQVESTTVFEELLKNVAALKRMAKSGADELYSPAINTKVCLLSTYKCFVNQSSLLKPADGQREEDFNYHLQRVKFSTTVVKLNNTNLNCRSCDSYKLKPAQEFLTNFRHLLQMVRYIY
ncbi:interleukin-21 [Sceloporus undulatus]|uniref:interleukin-21 n=1 Tax=Sceloporus undulatus TaxID=8520 RepID=UPI001C4B6004|nr:interleukin-21 [Sceloporus undulatus]